MLSWIQVFLEKNRKWLFGFLLIVIVVPFVFTIGSTPGLVAGKKMRAMKLFGYNLNDRKQLEIVVRNGALSIALQTGNEENAWMEAAQGYAFYRLFLLSMAQQLCLPTPNEEVLQAFLQKLPLFLDEKQQFNPETYNTYLSNLKQNFGKTFSLRQLLEEDCLCQQVREVLQKSGFVLPKECEVLFKHAKAQYNFDYFVVKNEEVVPEQVTEADLRDYFETHQEDYRVGQKADVVLLFFDTKNYAASLPVVTDEILENFFNLHKDLFKVEDGKEVVFGAVKDQVKSAWTEEQLFMLAEQSAMELALNVYNQSIAYESELWKQLLDKNDVRCIHSLAPYPRDNLPKNKGLPEDVLLKAFELSEDHFLSEPMRIKKGVVLVALKKFIPSYIPEMDEVRERLTADVKSFKREKAFEEKVEQLVNLLQNSNLEKAKTAFNLETKTLENFSLESSFTALYTLLQPHAIFEFMQNMGRLPLNQWSKAYPGVEDTVVLFKCTQQKLGEIAEESEDFKKFKQNYLLHQKQVQSNAVLHEIMEDAMNSGQHK